ncbi:hypothetical protein G210_4869 [Candida maltosa Xu316]|uniref:Uncharacterized protein n=1 Tax=Candida maltosa (strain Xu316) TaxID=1245528 RepID=M3JD88_CANMX|nr:hypothetical protein G210_4869 [Candida maltosa Xu316]
MSTMSLLDLPSDVIHYIISFVPNYTLKELTDILPLNEYILPKLYKYVIIGKFGDELMGHDDPPKLKFSIEPEWYETDYFPEFKDVSDFVKAHFMIGFPIPKRIYFRSLRHIYQFSKSDASFLLDNVKILTSFKFIFLNQRILHTDLLRKIKELPYKIIKIDDFFTMDESHFGSNDKYYKDFEFFRVAFTEYVNPKNIFKKGQFENLSELVFMPMIPISDAKYIPRCVKHLQLCLKASKETIIITSNELDVPPNLITFFIANFDGFDQVMFDFRKLTKLYHLGLPFGGEFWRMYLYRLELPPSLRILKADSYVDLTKLKQQCPDILRIDTRKIMIDPEDKITEFPEKLVEMNVSPMFLESMARAKEENSAEPGTVKEYTKFPSSVEVIRIYGYPTYDDEVEDDEEEEEKKEGPIEPKPEATIFSTTDPTLLPNLKKLELYEKVSLVGKLPRSIQSFRTEQFRYIDFDEMKELKNLVRLTISQYENIQFDFELPDSLRYLTIEKSDELVSLDIKANNLEYLVLRSNFSMKETISSSNLVLPPNLRGFELSYTAVEKFDKSFVFPKKLETLILKSNSLVKVPNLPPSLKKLCLTTNDLTLEDFTPFMFPFTLEELDLSRNKITKSAFYKIDLRHCGNLKKLDLSSNEKTDTFFLSRLPKRLEFLNLGDLEIKYFVGKFTQFPDLEEVYLTGNNLAHYFDIGISKQRTLSDSKGNFFGLGIRYLFIERNNFTTLNFFNLRNNLARNGPTFENLVVEPSITPLSAMSNLVPTIPVGGGDDITHSFADVNQFYQGL